MRKINGIDVRRKNEKRIAVKIEEVIVVEGKSDTIAVQRATSADTIETNGSAIDEQTLVRIEHAHQVRGVIVFTDPDYPGRRIRAIIEERIPTVKHAFLPKHETIAPNGKGLGIEHATDSAIQQALAAVYTIKDTIIEEIPFERLIEERFIGHTDSRRRRDRLSKLLSIGPVNSKGLKKRLAMFRISVDQFEEAVRVLNEEEKHE